ncbi:MAG: patatin-like phospholipase family protein [Methylocystaceae bacterium]
MKRWGVALSGGALKGAAHVGVLEVLRQEKMEPHMISGTSAGAMAAALYASGMSPAAMKKWLLNLKASDYLDYNWAGLGKFCCQLLTLHPGIKYLPSGVYRGNKLHALVLELTDNKTLKDCRLPVAITAVDLDRGNLVVFTNVTMEIENGRTEVIMDALLADAVRASISIPIMFIPADIGGQQFIDGGVRDILPLGLLKNMGAEIAVGVDLNDGLGRYHSPASGPIDIMTRTLDIMTEETSDDQELMVADLLIRPYLGKYKLDDAQKLGEIIRAGELAMITRAEALRELVK